MSCLVTEIFYRREIDSLKATELSEGDFNKGISTAARLHGVDLKPLQTLFYSLLLLGVSVFTFHRQLCTSGYTIDRCKYEADKKQTQCSPRFGLVCRQTLDGNLNM